MYKKIVLLILSIVAVTSKQYTFSMQKEIPKSIPKGEGTLDIRSQGNSPQVYSSQVYSDVYSEMELNVLHSKVFLGEKVRFQIQDDFLALHKNTHDFLTLHTNTELEKIIRSIHAKIEENQAYEEKYKELYINTMVELNKRNDRRKYNIRYKPKKDYNQLYYNQKNNQFGSKILNHIVQQIKIQNFENLPNTVKLCIDKKNLNRSKELELLTGQIIDTKNAEKLLEDNSKVEIDHATSIDYFAAIILNAKHATLSLFGECYCIKRPQRSDFEDRIIKVITENEKMDQISYFGFGPNHLFPDLRILTSLIKNKKKIKCIHIADPVYKNAIFILRTAKIFNKIRNNNQYDICVSDILKLVLQHNKEQLSLQDYLDDAHLLARITKFCLFIKLLSDLQEEPIELYVHEDSDAYIKFCKTHKEKMANLATVMDYTVNLNPHIERVFEQGLQTGGLMCKLLKTRESEIKETFLYKK